MTGLLAPLKPLPINDDISVISAFPTCVVMNRCLSLRLR